MTAGVRASAPAEGDGVTPGTSGPSAGPFPDLHTPNRLAWLDAVQDDEARRSMSIIGAVLVLVAVWCGVALGIWWGLR